MSLPHRLLTTTLLVALLCLAQLAPAAAQPASQRPLELATSNGPLTAHTVGHGSLYFTYGKLVIHVDPFSRVADYATLPKADQIWITHDHPDHLDLAAIKAIEKDSTLFIADSRSAEQLGDRHVIVLKNGMHTKEAGIGIEAVPAYNLVRERAPGQKYHPRGVYNGYLATFDRLRIYIAGDTECIPEMGRLGRIDLAFIPINLPYTMPPEEAVGCIKVIAPKRVIPYHQGNSDPGVVADLLEGSGIEVEVRQLP